MIFPKRKRQPNHSEINALIEMAQRDLDSSKNTDYDAAKQNSITLMRMWEEGFQNDCVCYH